MAPAHLPRLGENADEVWKRFRALATGGVVTPRGVLYPVAQLVPGPVFVLQPDGLCVEADASGLLLRRASPSQEDAFHAALNGDAVRIVLRSRPGYGSNYQTPRVLEVLHEPCGNTYAPRAGHLKTPTRGVAPMETA